MSITATASSGKYDTYKGSTPGTVSPFLGNIFGKYDTYKGSTLIIVATDNKNFFMGKYDTYKGSTRTSSTKSSVFFLKGKYDTYKGSTPILPYRLFLISIREI